MDLGAQEHILCFALHLTAWYELLKWEVEKMLDSTKEEHILRWKTRPLKLGQWLR